jgi:hypothetical protein
LLDETQTKETQNQTLFFYSGGTALDEDLSIIQDGKEIDLPRGVTGIGAIIVPSVQNNGTISFEQPYIFVVYNNQQYQIHLRYLSFNGEFFDYGSGINASAYIFPTIGQGNQGVNQNPLGAAMFLSPKLMRGMLAQKYILNDPLNNFPNFKLVHTEPNLIIDDLNNQGMNLPEIVYFQGIQGPIKIWEIEYTGKEELKEEYIDKDPTKYLTWKL